VVRLGLALAVKNYVLGSIIYCFTAVKTLKLADFCFIEAHADFFCFQLQ
jgi:hypothetical protein